MEVKRAARIIFAIAAFFMLTPAASAQLPPGAEVVPAGFTLVAERDLGGIGKGSSGLVGVSIDFFYGSKETAVAWIDAIIPKITKAQ
jgi:hypothetical protein